MSGKMLPFVPRFLEFAATMHDSPSPECQPRPSSAWWRESEVVWLIVLVTAAYACRAGDLPLRGEEPTRAQIAREMVQSGDAIVPREQGEPFLSRPPLQNWLIALSCQVLGRWDAIGVRAPSILATLLTSLLIYGYGRSFLSRTGSFAAAVAFATMGDMFQTGRLAETEAVFILLVTASLLVWHGGIVRGWNDAWSWCAGYTLMVLAALAKGPQAPTYFLTSVTVYLVATGQWKRLFTRAHFLGATVGLVILAAWMVPFYRQLGWTGTRSVWLGDSAIRFRDWKIGEVVSHLLVFPLEVFGCMMPWSALLLLYLSPRVRGSLREARPQVVFVTICLALGFSSCWLPPGGVSRYFSPLYPCVAVLIGAVIERCSRADAPPVFARAWWGFASVTAAVMFVAAGFALVASELKDWPRIGRLAEPPLLALAYAAMSLTLALATLRSRNAGTARRVQLGVVAISGFMALTFVGIFTDLRIRRSENTAAAVAQLKTVLPADVRLVSFGHVDSLFSYYYQRPIIPLPRDAALANLVDGVDYFCFFNPGTDRPAFPFAWQEVAAISVDRNHQEPPQTVVVIGRRVPAVTQAKAADGSVTATARAGSADSAHR
jgi:4-amino-4-deoxy-L-arabinose transferase-like glycosyltransferase